MDSKKSHRTSVTKNTMEESKQKVLNRKASRMSEDTKKAVGGTLNLDLSSRSSSHTKFYKKARLGDSFKVVSKEECLGVGGSESGSEDTFHCAHPPRGGRYTSRALLNRNLIKELDPIPVDGKWTERCPVSEDWDLAKRIEILVCDETAAQQSDRLAAHLRDLAAIASNGLRVDTLSSVCVILDYLYASKAPVLREAREALLVNLCKPILMRTCSDVVTYYPQISGFLGFLGYLLMISEEQSDFELVSRALVWQLSAPDAERAVGGAGEARGRAAPRRACLAAAAPALLHTVSRMVALTAADRFPAYLQLALLLACDAADNCLSMMQENIIENIFYRFNPYFPERPLPAYDINPADCQDCHVQLGDSSVNMDITLSLLLVLLKTTREHLDQNPKSRELFPFPDSYALRCLVWAWRYEVRARARRAQRDALTVVLGQLLHCFGHRMDAFSTILMPDVTSLSVRSELPPRADWIGAVVLTTSTQDTHFKKLLIHLVVQLLQVFPYNKFMLESRGWVLGLSCLLEPALASQRARFAPPLFAELRLTALQALVCALPLCRPALVAQHAIIRRILWYVEWYSENPFEIQVLYWCLRVLRVALRRRHEPSRQDSVNTLFDTHGVIVLIHLCNTLLEHKPPMPEKIQAVLGVTLRLLTSCAEWEQRLSCCVYPHIKWPVSVNQLAKRTLAFVTYSMENHFNISDRLLVALLNFIWESIVWNPVYRRKFVADDGIYKLLDIITMSSRAVQCVALGVLSDAARAGLGAAHLVTWRAAPHAAGANPMVVKCGATIAALLAAVFRDECELLNIRLNELGFIEDLECPLLGGAAASARFLGHDREMFVSPEAPACLPAANIAGSRMSKAFALLHMLGEELEDKVRLADEAYQLYNNIQLSVRDETTLVLCWHYLALTQCAAWREASAERARAGPLEPADQDALQEFLLVASGWAKEVRRQQEEVVKNESKKQLEAETSLYQFLRRVRTTGALAALRSVRCAALSADETARLADAAAARRRRARVPPTVCTYRPPIDTFNVTGQNLKVSSGLRGRTHSGDYH